MRARALTAELVGRLGGEAVCAVDPSETFAAAVRERFPEVDVRLAAAEQLPFGDGDFDVTAAQLVVHFMSSPVAGPQRSPRQGRRCIGQDPSVCWRLHRSVTAEGTG
jgi:SAM-dependent methyltransferase